MIGIALSFSACKIFRNTDSEDQASKDHPTTHQNEAGRSRPDREAEDEPVYVAVEDHPEFPGGRRAMYTWLSKHLKYPKKAKKDGIEGRVYVQFIVNKNGSLSDVEAVKYPSISLKEEAERVCRAMPRWEPGRQRGQPVRVRNTIPIYFRWTSDE